MSENLILPRPHKVLEIAKETDLEYTFRVEMFSRVDHGQFFQVSLPLIGEAPISVSLIGDGWVELTIRKVGKVTQELFRIRVGDRIFMRGPYGNSFPIEDFKDKDLVVIAGGTGVSPIRSTLTYFYEHASQVKSLHFIAGFKDENSILFREDLTRYSERFDTLYTLDHEHKKGFEVGFVTQHIKKIPFTEFEDYNVVIVGPPQMMHFAAQECLKQGAVQQKIWLSFERKMSCAVGKCGHCKINETYVCLEGPVFNYVTAQALLD